MALAEEDGGADWSFFGDKMGSNVGEAFFPRCGNTPSHLLA
jgi:hypothetical protein